MANRLTKGLEVSANVAIVIVAVLLCVVLVKSYVIPTPAARQSVGEPAGTRGIIKSGDAVAVSGVDWEKNRKTLFHDKQPSRAALDRLPTLLVQAPNSVTKKRGGRYVSP